MTRGQHLAATRAHAPDAPSPAAVPVVTDEDARDDFLWFDQHPGRLFRARVAPGGLWLVRRRGGVFLRTFRSQQPEVPFEDTDAVLGPLWFETAYPEDLNRTAQKRARAAGVRRGRQP